MKNAEMKLIRLDEADVIATSCGGHFGGFFFNSPSYQLLNDSENGNYLDLDRDGVYNTGDFLISSVNSALAVYSYDAGIGNLDGDEDSKTLMSGSTYLGSYFHYKDVTTPEDPTITQWVFQLCGNVKDHTTGANQ